MEDTMDQTENTTNSPKAQGNLISAVQALDVLDHSLLKAQERVAKAESKLLDVQARSEQISERYGVLRAKLMSTEIVFEVGQRSQLAIEVDNLLVEAASLKKERQRALSEKGTAMSVQANVEKERDEAFARLRWLLPEEP